GRVHVVVQMGHRHNELPVVVTGVLAEVAYRPVKLFPSLLQVEQHVVLVHWSLPKAVCPTRSHERKVCSRPAVRASRSPARFSGCSRRRCMNSTSRPPPSPWPRGSTRSRGMRALGVSSALCPISV